MSADSPRHARSGGPLTVPSQPPADRSLIDAVSGFINDVTLSSSAPDPKDTIQWARFETADINEPTPEGEHESEISPLLLILGYGSGVQVWLIPPNGEAQEVLSWRQGTVRVLRILPTPQQGDSFVAKRPLIALCDSASPGPMFCSLSFISVRGGEQVKSIKFKNPILDVQANQRSVVVSFSERFAVFDAGTLEDRMAITTCYPCPCPLGGSAPINPIALGDKWLAYADKKINPSKRSSGGCEGEGVSSYTATVLHAAKSLGKGLRGLGESVAHSLAGGRATSQSPSPPNADVQQPGVITILDIEGYNEDECQDSEEPYEPYVAHFVAHSEAVIALKFDASGMLLVTADRRGHDFHVFRINPHPCGPSLASVHHLYILHRGDTTAKVQDIAISADSRWTAVSSLRGTTHVFPIAPYGGPSCVRTHTQPRVVNRLSRFHRSAGLPAAHAMVSEGMSWFPNPRVPPYPQPVTVAPVAQLRPTASIPTHTITRTSSGRQRLSSLSEDSGGVPLLARARFGTPPPSPQSRTVAYHALYLMAANGCLMHYLIHPRPAVNVPKEKVCEESPIEVEVEAVAQWPLQRPQSATDLLAPLPATSPLLQPLTCRRCMDVGVSEEERWLSQVEIVTHAGPHRRLWMGPQFVFKTYNSTGSNSSLSEAETVEVDTSSTGMPRSNPVNMPGARPLMPVLIDSGSASSLEHSPSDSFRRKSVASERAVVCDVQLKEDLAEAMKEDHGCEERRSLGTGRVWSPVVRAVDPLGTVVVPPEPAPPPSPIDTDLYTHSNTDEATFRPVVRAPAAIPPHPDLLVRPLPCTTRIPVETMTPHPHRSPDDEPEPLNSNVVIPAELTAAFHQEPDTCAFKIEYELNVDVKAMKMDVDTNVNKDLNECESRVKEESVNVTVGDCAGMSAESEVYFKTMSLPKVSNVITDDIQKRSINIRSKKSPTPKLTSVIVENDEISIKDNLEYNDVNDNQRTAKFRVKLPAGNTQKAQKISEDISASVSYNKIKSTSREKYQIVTEGKVELKDDGIDVKHISSQIVESDNLMTIKNDSELENNVTLDIPKKSSKVRGVNYKKNTRDTFSDQVDADIATDDIKGVFDIRHHKQESEIFVPNNNEEIGLIKEEPQIGNSPMCYIKNIEDAVKEEKDSKLENISTEEQAWDMLLNESDKSSKQNTLIINKPSDDKPKLKKNRKNKLKSSCDEVSANTVKDESFVEILNIEHQPNIVSELVSISTATTMPISSYSSKSKQICQRKAVISEIQDEFYTSQPFETPRDNLIDSLTKQCFAQPKTAFSKQLNSDNELVHTATGVASLPSNSSLKSKNKHQIKVVTPDIKDLLLTPYANAGAINCSTKPSYIQPHNFVAEHISMAERNVKSDDITDVDKIDNVAFDVYTGKEISKRHKTTETFPSFFHRSNKRGRLPSDKNIIIIDSQHDDFPEIKVTRGMIQGKRSADPDQETDGASVKPLKSWSSIAASKADKNFPEVSQDEFHIPGFDTMKFPKSFSNKETLNHKLMELCKRTDIMVAECDAPDELNVDDNDDDNDDSIPFYSMMRDLPPLQPLDFPLNDLKFDVMKDSLLETNNTKTSSPICKINIDDILSSIKETTTKAIESSTYNNYVSRRETAMTTEEDLNLIDEGQSSDKTKLHVESREKSKKEIEIMYKSSDDDNISPIASQTDSDEKPGATSLAAQPLSKQNKAKKSRKKRK